MQSQGFTCSVREPCLYKKTITNDILIVIVYVNDILLACQNPEILDDTITILSTEFEIKNLRFPTRFIGIDISQDTHS